MAYSFWKKVALLFVFYVSIAVAVIAVEVFCTAQAPPGNPAPSDKQINVNWLYGSSVPKTVQLRPLTGDERLKLYVRQTYMTPGIYIKTTLFAVHDQITNSNPEWGE